MNNQLRAFLWVSTAFLHGFAFGDNWIQEEYAMCVVDVSIMAVAWAMICEKTERD